MPEIFVDAMPNGTQARDLSTPAQLSVIKASAANGAGLVQASEMPNAPRPEDDDAKSTVAKKKKKKRAKKPAAKNKAGDENCTSSPSPLARSPAVLCISRNKHWKYISSYHGPWLQLPLELLESLLILNLDPITVTTDLYSPPEPGSLPEPGSVLAQFSFTRLQEHSSSLTSPGTDSPHVHSPSSGTSTPYAQQPPMRAAPPPIDPGVFRSVAAIRRLIDEAAELAVRASSRLSAAALSARDALGLSGGGGGGSWGASQSLGLGGMTMGDLGYGSGGGGRNAPMSATRVHRLRALAVQKLADAYKADEIASSVMVMQRGTVFDDVAEKVLKVDPKNVDARYVHFFHEKIPSRQLAESTSTAVLDQLIAENPQHLEFYRTRGVVHCFRDEYVLAARDFTFALKESRVVRRTRHTHDPIMCPTGGGNHPRAKRKSSKVNGQAPPAGTATVVGEANSEPPLPHPSLLPDAPVPLEPQVLFHRGAAYLSHAFFLIEEALFTLEGIPRIPPNDFDEVHLAYITHGRYGGTEIGNPDGPLGAPDGVKARAYHAAFTQSGLRERVCALLRKSKRDHERFLAHFDIIGAESDPDSAGDILQQIEYAFLLLETFRPYIRTSDTGTSNSTSNSAAGKQGALLSDIPLPFSTYHPLLLESHFSVLLCLLLLGEFDVLAHTFVRTARAVAGLEGYPVFLPPRSMAQAEFCETLERLAGGWRRGGMPDALVHVVESKQQPHTPMPTPSPLVQPDDQTAVPSSSAGPSMSTNGPSASGSRSPASDEDNHNPSSGPPDPSTEATAVRRIALEHLRLLLAPLHARLRTRAEGARTTNGGHGLGNSSTGGGERKPPAPLNLALHGARVEVILAWLGAVQLPELEAIAEL